MSERTGTGEKGQKHAFMVRKPFSHHQHPVANHSVLILKEDLEMISLRTETGNWVETVVLQHFMVFLAILPQPSPLLFGVTYLPFSVSHEGYEPYHVSLANSLTPSSYLLTPLFA